MILMYNTRSALNAVYKSMRVVDGDDADNNNTAMTRVHIIRYNAAAGGYDFDWKFQGGLTLKVDAPNPSYCFAVKK